MGRHQQLGTILPFVLIITSKMVPNWNDSKKRASKWQLLETQGAPQNS